MSKLNDYIESINWLESGHRQEGRVLVLVDMADGKGAQFARVSIDKECMAMSCGQGELAKYGGRYAAAEIQPYLDEMFSVRYPETESTANNREESQ